MLATPLEKAADVPVVVTEAGLQVTAGLMQMLKKLQNTTQHKVSLPGNFQSNK